MSVHRVTEIRCDGTGCDNAIVWNGNAIQARLHARTNCDWLTGRDGGTDYCTPECRNNPKERP